MAQMYNPQEIISKANAMKEQSSQLQKMIQEMSSIVSDMSSVWKSPAQQSFTSKFSEIAPELMSFVTSINSFADRATEQAQAVIKSEEGPV